MMGLVIAIHVIVCALLIVIILIQRGHGGGLVESFSGVESIFGTKTNELLARITTILAIVFFITCIGLALFSARRGKSLMRGAAVSSGQLKDKAESAPQAAAKQVPPVAPAQPAGTAK